MSNWFGGDKELSEDEIHEEYKSRKIKRDKLERWFVKAVAANDMKSAKEIRDLLDVEFKPAFKELVYNDTYLDDLKVLYKNSEGTEYEGTNEQLVKDSFDHWNGVEQNVALGAKQLYDGFDNLDDGLKKRMKRVFDTYYNTDAFGAGSRNLGEQTYNLAVNTIVDPVNLLGAGIGIKMGKSLVGKEALKKNIYTSLGIGGISAVEGGVADVVQQNVEMEARGGAQEYSPARTGVVAGVSGMMPQAGKKIGQAVGGTARALSHLPQAVGRATKVGKTQGMLGAVDESIKKTGLDRTIEGNAISGNIQTREALSGIWDSAKKGLKDAWEAEPVKKIPILALDKFLSKMEQDPYMDGRIPSDISKLIYDTKPTLANALTGRKDAPLETTYDALKRIKQIFYKKAQSDPDNARHYNKYYDKLVKIEEEHAVNKDKFKLLKGAFSDFQGIGKDKDPVAKQIREIAEAGPNHASVMKNVDTLINSFINTPTTKSLSSLGGIEKVIKNVLKTAKAGGVKGLEDSWNEFLEPVRVAVSERLMANGNALLHKLLDKDEGMKILIKLYPDAVAQFNNITKLKKQLVGGKGNRNSGSVIVNMTAARLAGGSAKSSGGGPFVQAAAAVGGVYGAGMLSPSRLVDNQTFRNAMAAAFRRKDGRIETKTMRKLMRQFNWSEQQAKIVQDALWTIFATKPIVRSEETRKGLSSYREKLITTVQ